MAAPSKSKKKQNAGRNQAAHRAPVTGTNPTMKTPGPVGLWIRIAKLHTLPLAIAGVVAGAGAAASVDGLFHWAMFLLCAGVAIFLQLGVNFGNDYSDGVRGTDAHRAGNDRLGPPRWTATGLVEPKKVLYATIINLAIAAIFGLVITIHTQHWWFIGVGLACIWAAWAYTGGKHPYGYIGFGEVAVFIFFGLVATIGTTYVMIDSIPQTAWVAATGVGLLSVAVLLANNLRDIPFDRLVGKRTLSTFIGKRATQILYTICVLVPFVLTGWMALFWPVAWLCMLVLLMIMPTLFMVWMYKQPRELIPVIAITSFATLAWAIMMFIAWIV